MKIFKRLFRNYGKDTPKRDFSAFFNYAPREEKIHLLEKVVKEANEDQRRLMKEVKESLG